MPNNGCFIAPFEGMIGLAEKTDSEGKAMDDDLNAMSREQLLAEVRKLRAGIRQHRDSSGHDLCWYHPALWSLLPEEAGKTPEVPDWPQFMRGCVAYRASLDRQCPQAVRIQREFAAEDE